jgi:hypothetical protein
MRHQRRWLWDEKLRPLIGTGRGCASAGTLFSLAGREGQAYQSRMCARRNAVRGVCKRSGGLWGSQLRERRQANDQITRATAESGDVTANQLDA